MENVSSFTDDPIKRPLVVDLDHTLIKTDLLVESFFGFVSRSPFGVFKLPRWLFNGKAFLKSKLAEVVDIDVSTLPYDEMVLARIREARTRGRPVYLASASNQRFVKAIADHLGLFEGWFASDGAINLSGATKAALLVNEFGEGGFDYIGNSQADLKVWSRAATAIVVGSNGRIERQLGMLANEIERVATDKKRFGWFRLLRPHQWAKNALVAVPLLTAHKFSMTSIETVVFAAMAFSALASSVYILNDLLDIQADRSHPTKRNRPFASGEVSFLTGAIAALVCLCVSIIIGISISLQFLTVLGVYLATTAAYSLVLKRKMLIDAITLAGLYTIRVIGGAVAINVPMSEWLMGFSTFIFLSLALIKRYSEMALRFDKGLPDPTNRNYRTGDLPVIAALAAAAGYCAIIVMSLYLSSDTVRSLYTHPAVLWLVCPLLLYWISRMLMLSHRRLVNDDPILFAVRDKISWLTGFLILVVGAVAA